MLVETDEEGIPSFTASNDESFITLLEKITDIQSERALLTIGMYMELAMEEIPEHRLFLCSWMENPCLCFAR